MLVKRHADTLSFVQSLERSHSVRWHAAVLLAAATLAGLLASWVLRWMGLEAPYARFPIAVLAGYAIFLVLVDLWLAYIGIKRSEAQVEDPGVYPGDGGGASEGAARAGESFSGGGGTFDGGGASAGFDTPAGQAAAMKGEAVLRAKGAAGYAALETKAQAGATGLSAADAAGGLAAAGEFFPIVILLAIVGLFVAAVGWTVALTPMVLVETAVEVAVASGLIRSMARTKSPTWFASLLDRTAWKAVALVALAVVLGIIVRLIDPSADTIGEAVAHLMKGK